MSEGFPLLTSKKMYTKGIIHEMIWFLKGDTNIKYLVDNDCHIWDGDCYKNYKSKVGFSSRPYDRNIISQKPSTTGGFSEFVIGDDFTKEEFIEKIKTDEEFCKRWGDLGNIYGKQWRKWNKFKHDKVFGSSDYEVTNTPIDQIANLINDLKINPDSRRLIVSAWNVGELDKMVLPPCHYGFQCYTREMDLEERKSEWCKSLSKDISYGEDLTHERLDDLKFPKRKIDLKWTQRSCDSPLGIPFNITSYALLLHLLAKDANMIPNDLIFSGGDCHIYLNQIDAIKEQLKNETFDLPILTLSNKSIDDIKFEDISISGYQSSGIVKIPLSN